MTTGAPTVALFKRLTRTILIVFTFVTDPVRDGLVETLAHPGGNITGFTIFEHTMAGNGSRCSRSLLLASRALR